jgi:hypothetical protein
MSKVEAPKSNTAITWTSIFEGMWLGVNIRMGTKMTRVKQRLYYLLKICLDHSRHNEKHNLGEGGTYMTI